MLSNLVSISLQIVVQRNHQAKYGTAIFLSTGKLVHQSITAKSSSSDNIFAKHYPAPIKLLLK